MSENSVLEILQPLYGGSSKTSDANVTLPFVLQKEMVEVSADGKSARLLELAIERVTPQCPHFQTCGGCQYQMAGAQQQLDIKRSILIDQLRSAGVSFPADISTHGREGYGYRNRIRLRVERVDGDLRLGYNVRTTTEFLPITTCPIAAPILWTTAQALLAAAKQDEDVALWLSAASEVELFCNDDLTRIQVTLLCAPRTKVRQGSIERVFAAAQKIAPEIVGLTAIASDARTGPTGRTLATTGTAGLNYRVLGETYWISRGGFFQVNRFLLGTLMRLVCEDDGKPRSDAVAWDLFAGVGLFSRVLARSFARVVAVEANPTAAADNRVALSKLGAEHQVVGSTTLEFLAKAVVQRERPDLIVLDPPRAGAGVEACELLLRLKADRMVYVSCDPTTLARDLAVLQREYSVATINLVDLFPQTFHLETVVALERKK
jgi:23S rRNA (uracil1939-C5)-methyltransferase